MVFRYRLNWVNLISVWWPRSVQTQNFLDFQKRSILSKIMLLEFRCRSCLQKAFSEKPTMPSFRAYFITLIGVLVSWNYRLINDNWNVDKFNAFFLSFERSRLGLSNHNTLRMVKVLKTWCLQLTSRIKSYSDSV